MKKNTVQQRTTPDWAIYLFLFAATLVVYGQVHNYAFLDLDDAESIPVNPFQAASQKRISAELWL